MLVQLASLRADLDREANGDWIAAPELGPDVAFLVRSIHYPLFQAARDRAMLKLAEQFGDAAVPPEENARAFGPIIANHLLLGWRGFDEPYDRERSLAVLADEGFRRVRSAVLQAAAKVGVRAATFLEDAEKNSAPPSATVC